MSQVIILLRHANPEVVEGQAISEWVLSEKGKERAKEIGGDPFLQDVDVVVWGEQKALLTAQPLIDVVQSVEVIHDTEISEMNRDQGKYLTPEQYDDMVRQAFEHPETAFNGWESLRHAVDRITRTIKKVSDIEKYKDAKILFVGGAFTMNKIVGDMKGEQSPHARIAGKQNKYGDYAVIIDGKVVKDFHEAVEVLRSTGERLK